MFECRSDSIAQTDTAMFAIQIEIKYIKNKLIKEETTSL